MWGRINSFIEELNFPHKCGKGDYILESLFYLLGMKANSNEPYFVGKDIATALGYAKPENAISSHVSEEDKTSTLIQGSGSNYKSKTILINESGLYSLIFGSKLESAKKFKRWVTSEILPTIRKTGGYQNGSRHIKRYVAEEDRQNYQNGTLESNAP